MTEAQRTDASTECGCKIATVIARYGLSDLDETLVEEWTAPRERSSSLRTLASAVNRRIVSSVVEDEDLPSDLDPEVVHERLAAEDAPADERIGVVRRLERAGIDAAELEDDFVSHQTVYRHLRGCLGVSKDPGDGDRIQKASETLFALQSRTNAVTTNTLERLRNSEDLALGQFDVFVDINVACQECDRYMELGEVLGGGGCECRR